MAEQSDEYKRVMREANEIVKMFASGEVDNKSYEEMREISNRLEELEERKATLGGTTDDKLSLMALKMHKALEEFKAISGLDSEEAIARAAPFILDLILIPIVSMSGVKASVVSNKFEPVRRKILLKIMAEIVRFIGEQQPGGPAAKAPGSLAELVILLAKKAEEQTKQSPIEEESRGKKEAEFTADAEFQEWLKGWEQNTDN